MHSNKPPEHRSRRRIISGKSEVTLHKPEEAFYKLPPLAYSGAQDADQLPPLARDCQEHACKLPPLPGRGPQDANRLPLRLYSFGAVPELAPQAPQVRGEPDSRLSLTPRPGSGRQRL